MTISSRTPEGTPHRCPVCGHGLRVEPSLFFGDAPCPRCGGLRQLSTDGGPNEDRH
jgi:acyl carrier protein